MSVMMRNGLQYAGVPDERLENLEEIVGDGQQSVGSDLTDAVTQLNSSLSYRKLAENIVVSTTTATQTIPTLANARNIILYGKVNGTIRGSIIIPYSHFKRGIDVYIPVMGGNVTGQIFVKYISDTSISVLSTNATFNYLDIFVDG